MTSAFSLLQKFFSCKDNTLNMYVCMVITYSRVWINRVRYIICESTTITAHEFLLISLLSLIDICMYVCMYVCMYLLNMYVCMYVCMYLLNCT